MDMEKHMDWRRPFGRRRIAAPEIKDSRTGPLIALTAGRARAENRVRAFIEFLSGLYGDVPEWDR